MIDDFDYDYVPSEEESKHNIEARKKLQKVIDKVSIYLTFFFKMTTPEFIINIINIK